ncbi:MAG: Crp/Fnr family transcriptional regulator [Cyclobacteriaceae bacterium]|jgi:CRP-like cAMP-binding protein|nr:Crp/Fnr family transcriptional regulator [Cyclobacteriaceae bacterium]
MIDPNLLLAKGATYKKLATGEILFSEGDVCEYYFQITRGQLRWVNFNNEGDEYLQTVADEGSSIGELPLFDGEVYAATAIANKPSQVLRLPKNLFHQLLYEHPHIHYKFSHLLTQRLRFKFFLLKEIAHHDSEKVVEALLSFLNKKKEHLCGTCNQIKLNRRQIAQMTGLRVETVIRVMRNLSEKGIIQIHKRKAYYGNSTGCINSRCPS